jgi:geranylgeranyl pyrophosphate synthase
MTTLPRRREATTLVALLEAELGREDYAGLSRETWDAVLFGPAREFLARPGKSFRAHAVAAGWRMAGQDPALLPVELPLLVELIHAGSLIVDDIEDGSPTRRGLPSLHVAVGMPVALNTGNWLYFWPMVLLSRLGFPPPVELALLREIQLAMFRCHEGQALDLSARIDQLAQAEVPAIVAATTSRKTGALFRLALRMGARAAGCTGARLEALGQLGHDLGVTLQQLDDLGSLRTRRDKGREDLAGRRPTWPWAWLAELLPPDRFDELRGRLAHEDHERSIEALLLALGDRGALAIRRSFADIRTRTTDPILEAQLSRLERSYG